MLRSVRIKFIFLSTLFITISVGIPMLYLINQLDRNFDQRSRALIQTSLDMIHYSLYQVMEKGMHADVQEIVDGISLNKSIKYFRLYDSSDKILFSSTKNETGKKFSDFDPNHPKFEEDPKWEITYIKKGRFYTASEPIRNDKFCQSCHGNKKVIAYIDIHTDLTSAESQFSSGLNNILYVGVGIILILIFGLLIIFNNFINKPINKFIFALDEVEQGSLSIQLDESKPDEFGKLNRHFNSMIKNLNSSRNRLEEMHLEQLQHTDKLVSIGELTSETAHEINNYAAIIMSRVDFLLLELQQKENLKYYKEDLIVILDQIKNINLITGNILKHSKRTIQKDQLVDLVKIVENCIALLQPLIKKKQAHIIKHFEANPLVIYGNAMMWQEAFTNLILNSLDFISEKGTIEITTEIVNENDEAEIYFSDNGTGIDPENIDQIFSPFYTTKTNEKGTGLGLYIVKKICDKHDAKIKCSSELNIGTKFSIKFKINRKPNA